MNNKLFLTRQPINWFLTQNIHFLNPTYCWLTKLSSITKSFARCCQQVSIKIYQEGFTKLDNQDDETALLPKSSYYWLREVMLFGDNCPWLYGRTVIPESTLTGPEYNLINLGNVPLGYYLFNKKNLTRDYIHLGIQNNCLVRRSLFRLTGKPLLLTECFLPNSPVYKNNWYI